MKILKEGDKTPKAIKKTCKSCKTVFEYTSQDVHFDNREGGTYLFCPYCDKFITITSPDYTDFDRSRDC